MEYPKIENNKKEPKNLEQAVDLFVSGQISNDLVINYLRKNKSDITEFCLQVNEAYKKGDISGIIKISMLLEKAL